MSHHYSELDLENLIRAKLQDCHLPNVCNFLSNEEGTRRVIDGVKEIIFKHDVPDVDAALAQLESILAFQ